MWFTYSILGLLLLWVWDFTKKVILKKWGDKDIFLFFCFILYVWTYFLWDKLSIYNIIWFFLWILSLYLLSWFNFKEKHKISNKWVIWVIMALTWIIWGHSYFKYIVNDIDIPTYTFYKVSVSLCFIILFMIIRNKFKIFNIKELKKILPYSVINSIIFVIYYLFIIPKIYSLWTLSLSYKILSYSLIVPILLSLILYNEKLTKKENNSFHFDYY